MHNPAAVAAASLAYSVEGTEESHISSSAHAHQQPPTDVAAKRLSQTSTSSSKKTKTHIGPWRLGRTLGRGSSGRVRLARHSQTGQLAAVKIVPKAVVADAMNAANGEEHGATGLPYGIEREVIIMKLIEHENVMALYDVWENKGELYLVLEYIEGGELFDYLIKKGRLEEREAASYFLQIINGVDYCHRFNICHRDLKPENLLLDKNRNIKIADFGMAALETDRMLETSCGSPHYASPEIVAGKTYHGAPSDIWSCGIILFALLTGHLPFDDDNIRRLLLKVQTGKFNMPSELSPYAKDLIWRMLRTDPTTRITMDEIFRHPFVRKYNGDRSLAYSQTPSYEHVARPVASVQDIDIEILKNLQILWHGEDAEVIIEKLLSSEPNPEKTFYCLLMKYRHDHAASVASSEPSSLPAQNRDQIQSQPPKSRSHSSRKHRRGVSHTSHRMGSRGSLVSVSSAHKRGVSFTHVKKRSQQSIRSLRGSATNSAVASPRKGTGSAGVPSAGTHVAPGPTSASGSRGTFISSAPSWLTRSPPRTRDSDFEALLDSAFNKPIKTKKSYGSLLGSPVEARRNVTDPANASTVSRANNTANNSTSKRAVTISYKEEFEYERPASLFDPREAGDIGNNLNVSRAQSTSQAPTQPRERGASATSDTPNYLPMIFEEGDRFADAIEEEFHLNMSDKEDSSTNATTPMLDGDRKSSEWENLFEFTERGDQMVVGEDSMLDISFHRDINLAPIAPRENVRNSTELYRDLQFPEIPDVDRASLESGVPRTQSKMKISGKMQTDNFMKRPSSMSLNDHLNRQHSSGAPSSSSSSQRQPLVSRDMNIDVTPLQETNVKPFTRLQTTVESHKRSQIHDKPRQPVLQPAPVFKEKPVVEAPRRQAPPAPVHQRPVIVETKSGKSHNQSTVIAPVQQPKDTTSKSSRTKSFIRRFGFAPKREAPPAPTKVTMIQSSDYGSDNSKTKNNATPNPPPARASSASASSTGDPWNVTQSWFMKMFSRPTSAGKQPQQSVYSNLTCQQLEDEFVALLSSWRKYGISNLSVARSSIKCHISSRNALKIKSAKLHIDISQFQQTCSCAQFFHDRGSQSSFAQLYEQLHAHLVSQDLLLDLS